MTHSKPRGPRQCGRLAGLPVVLVVAFTVAACGGGDDSPAPAASAPPEVPAPAPAPPSTSPPPSTPPAPAPTPPAIANPTGPGHLEAAEPLNTIPATAIASAIGAAADRFPGLAPTYAVTNYRIRYTSIDADGQALTVSGLLSVPAKATGAASPVLSYQHGTTFKDSESPSNHATADEPAVVLASLGFIVLAADYAGYGVSRGVPHPYLLATPTAAAVIDLLTAARTWRAQNGVADNGQLYLAGYSEGGYATVAAHRTLQANASPHLAGLVIDVAGAGPYFVRVTLDTLLERVRDDNPVLGTLITPGFLRLLGSGVRQQVRELLFKRLVPQDSDVVFDQTIVDKFLADDDAAIEALGDVHDWAPRAPVRLFHGVDDQTVPYVVSERTLATMQGRGATDVTLTQCNAVPSSHLGCIGPYLAYALGQIATTVRDL
jgi:dienelactone hydrolase